MSLAFRTSTNSETDQPRQRAQWVRKLSALGLSIAMAAGIGVGLTSCSCDRTGNDETSTVTTSHTAAPFVDKKKDGNAVQKTDSSEVQSRLVEGPSESGSYATDGNLASGPQTPQPAPTQPEMPAYLQPGAPLPQTNLDKKYAPLGVPVMAGPQYGKPFVFTTTFTREQTVALHENQVGEKMQRVGDALPVVGEPLSTMGSAIAQSTAFASQHDDTCVRAWIELAPGYWGTYATYVTGEECPEQTSHSYQLPW